MRENKADTFSLVTALARFGAGIDLTDEEEAAVAPFNVSERAKGTIKAKVVELDEQYHASKGMFFQQQAVDLSPSVVASFDILEAMAAGNLLWGMSSPRYDLSAKNPYAEYYRLRNDGGAHFFDDCTESDEIISNNTLTRAVDQACKGEKDVAVSHRAAL
ncbi:uncharacterized protein HRG_07569 [Hirsutella rhossiliensis]|uniref:Uncharacterized protein n=1 Tax=Hirsutella rhossiliensis TaxID=111463 RepID=A0A9P8SHY6_9HYPO|nr:uncharacterized protein HRG_07569 [Hirsutella rhossiliensis]KAH0961491.1 hypothetical protein HRG_07569 [Hirsutella rhossiliensis]